MHSEMGHNVGPHQIFHALTPKAVAVTISDVHIQSSGFVHNLYVNWYFPPTFMCGMLCPVFPVSSQNKEGSGFA